MMFHYSMCTVLLTSNVWPSTCEQAGFKGSIYKILAYNSGAHSHRQRETEMESFRICKDDLPAGLSIALAQVQLLDNPPPLSDSSFLCCEAQVRTVPESLMEKGSLTFINYDIRPQALSST